MRLLGPTAVAVLVAGAAMAQQPKPSPSPSPKTKATPSFNDQDLDRLAGREPGQPQDKAKKPPPSTMPSGAAAPEGNRVNESEAPVPEASPGPRAVESGAEGNTAPGSPAWADRAQAMRDAAAEAEKHVQDLESQAQALLWQYLQSTDTNEILRLKAEQQEILDQIPDAKKAAEEAQKALADFEREAGQAGVPPGELREKKKP